MYLDTRYQLNRLRRTLEFLRDTYWAEGSQSFLVAILTLLQLWVRLHLCAQTRKCNYFLTFLPNYIVEVKLSSQVKQCDQIFIVTRTKTAPQMLSRYK